jgi:hypothetical protein
MLKPVPTRFALPRHPTNDGTNSRSQVKRTVMRLSGFAVALPIAAVAAGGCAPALMGVESPLRYRWSAGDELTYRVTTDSRSLLLGIPFVGEMEMVGTMGQVVHQTVDQVGSDGTATVQNRIESVTMTISAAGQTMSYDSGAPSASTDSTEVQIAESLDMLIGQPTMTVVDPRGVVQSVSGIAELRQRFQATNRLAADVIGSLGGAEQLFGDRGIYATGVFPLDVVEVGDSWPAGSVTTPTPIGGLNATSTFTLVGFDVVDGREIARIAVAHDIALEPSGFLGPATFELGDVSGEGEVLFDRARGEIYRVTNHISLPMTVSVVSPDGMGIDLEAVNTVTTTIEVVER